MTNAIRDENHVTVALGVSSSDSTATLPLTIDSATGRLLTNSASGSGDVVGPASATDNAIARFDSTTGKLIQNSGVIIDDSDNVTAIGNITGAAGQMTITGGTASGDDLLLTSTSNATKGTVAIGSLTDGLIYDEVNKRLSIGDIGNTITVGGTSIATKLTIHAEGAGGNIAALLHRHSATAGNGAKLYGARSRGDEATPTVVSSGDNLFDLVGLGFDGTDYEEAAHIFLEVDGTPGAGDMPGRIVFKVSPDGSATPAEAMRISQDKSVNLASLTASELVATDASKNLQSLAVATYPSLTEISYVKGVTSSIQTQLGTKLANVVEDTTPQLGGSLDVNGQKIVSVSNGNIDIEPNGTGNVLLGNYTFDADQTVGAGQDNYVLTYDNTAGLISLEAASGGGANTALSNLASVAINTSLISDTDSTDSIGSTGVRWLKGWFDDMETTNMPTVGGTAILSSLTAPQFTTIELGHATDSTISRVSAGQLAVEGVNILMNGGALGTPSSGTVTNLTGTASININGTVGATTPTTGAFTTASTSSTLTASTTIELGHATDTTLSRVSAGVIAVEGVTIPTISSTSTLSNKTLTAPKFADAGFIADANGNEQIVFQTTASAVNEFEVTNAATGNAPQLAVTGGDTNIDLVLVPKGTGIVKGELKRFMVRLKDSATALTTGTTVGGDYRIANRAITIKAVGAYVDTAAATGTNLLTIDINDSGTTIMTTNKITIDVGEKTSTTAATQPALTDTAVAADAIITFDIDQVNETTPATGLVVWIDYIYA